ncbi:DUF4183 domain-containing protein [Kineothrix sp. MB12-C1]|uniref:DUF4183 domain-containing protein n=1 Tax=Kineothrix sp. MB12-C1 TaxID=3070215 RepID=UPI0027D232A1|nr:DUF4183 domain-containing protein [Kineothrix sp. MB12-C1]WMC91407.1 DUF4183 domain-containing protein [Kineothrix sp. MB12-C1]
MATQLFKLEIDATTTTEVKVNPEVEKYFYLLNETDRAGDVLTIPAESFIDDAGDDVTGTLTTVVTDNGYYLLFINGVLQQSSLYTVSGDGSEVTVNEAATIPVNAPITLIVTNFAPISDSDTTVIT